MRKAVKIIKMFILRLKFLLLITSFMGVDILPSPLCGVIIARFFSNLMGIFSFKEFAQGWKKLLELAVNFYV